MNFSSHAYGFPESVNPSYETSDVDWLCHRNRVNRQERESEKGKRSTCPETPIGRMQTPARSSTSDSLILMRNGPRDGEIMAKSNPGELS
ncbi:MAG: hypothetical protein PHV74_04655 [Dehalococcoidia bacterium]|nr:hypothetical protein [Dehalococcoidia bacterium]